MDIIEEIDIPIHQLFTHPDNPRKELGDLDELADSIKNKGLLQPLVVVKHGMTAEDEEGNHIQGYRVIIGHRRMAASILAGRYDVPLMHAVKRKALSFFLQRRTKRIFPSWFITYLMIMHPHTVVELMKRSFLNTSLAGVCGRCMRGWKHWVMKAAWKNNNCWMALMRFISARRHIRYEQLCKKIKA